jgi:hypothetical protein
MKKYKVKSFEEKSIKDRREEIRKNYPHLGKDELANSFVNKDVRDPTSDDLELLKLIWSTEPMGFFDLCNAMRQEGTCPAKGEKAEWGALFRHLGELEGAGWIKCERIKKNLESLQLTDKGADVVRNFADSKRPIFDVLDEEPIEIIEWDREQAFGKDDIPF